MDGLKASPRSFFSGKKKHIMVSNMQWNMKETKEKKPKSTDSILQHEHSATRPH